MTHTKQEGIAWSTTQQALEDAYIADWRAMMAAVDATLKTRVAEGEDTVEVLVDMLEAARHRTAYKWSTASREEELKYLIDLVAREVFVRRVTRHTNQEKGNL